MLYKNEPKPYEPFGGDTNIKVDLSNNATKADLKNATGIDTSKLAAKSGLAKIDKIDIEKLAPISVDLSKLSDGVKNDVVKKTVYDKLVSEVNNIDNSGFVLKTKYDTYKSDSEKKISDPDKKKYLILVKKAYYSAEISEIESKIPNNGSLATTFVLTAVENKIPDVSNLVRKTDYN